MTLSSRSLLPDQRMRKHREGDEEDDDGEVVVEV